ncbi:hypothetical protein [Spirosoma linguale]|uniref:Carboxypeptidase regulatory-like domain-containing protein n=1 Tax=Spirosoma linguale (strain ATCC 33905 / DSM 74 / LMG 10896 / Claus 1) TaxID=504472 RepID=D2QEY1_SPILD|nr:conserved hypothetical protein [Spirosoma linguale DSM 74]
MSNPILRYVGNRSILLLVSLSLLSFSLSALGQQAPRRKAAKPVAKQGICGVVREKRGNFMPSPDSPRPNPDGAPVVREVLIFPLLNISQVETGESGFINSVGDVKPVKTVTSGKDGKFCVSLPVGQYTVMVREPKGLYANLSDSQGNIFPVSVQKNKSVSVTVDITHQAVF